MFPEAEIDANLEWAQEHFGDHVRAGRPLPTLRAGKQPYGILPVTALDLWGATQKMENWPRGMPPRWRCCGGLQDYWTDESATAPRMGNHANPDIDFAEVFAMDGLSTSYAIRNIFGSSTPRNSSSFYAIRETTSGIACNGRRRYRRWRSSPGIRGVTPRAMLTLCDPARSELSLPLVQSSSSADFTFNYIDQLLKAPNLEALLQHASIPAPFSVLYLLLRHSMMVEYANAAARALGRAPHLRAEPEHVRFTQLPMETPLDRISAAGLHTGPAFTQPDDTNVQDFRKSLEALTVLKTDKLSMLMRGALDLSSHRLDAWVTSFATKRLKTMRQKDPAGVYLGGYGWVEDLQPGPPRTEVTPPPAERDLFSDFGTIQALSMRRRSIMPRRWRCCEAGISLVLAARQIHRPSRLRSICPPIAPARRNICWMVCDPASRSPPCWGIASSAHCTSVGWTSSSMRSASSCRSNQRASTRPGKRSSLCRRPTWWMGSTSCAEQRGGGIARLFSARERVSEGAGAVRHERGGGCTGQ